VISEYPTDPLSLQAHYKKALLHEAHEDWHAALTAYMMATKSEESSISTQAYVRAEQIAIGILEDYDQFLKIRAERKRAYPKLILPAISTYEESLALTQTEQVDQAITLGLGVLGDPAIPATDQSNLVDAWIDHYLTKRDWTNLLVVMQAPQIKKIVEADPKMIYQRGLAHFNAGQLDTAMSSISDHYDTLLAEPGWLAKSIILVSDIYVLQEDNDSAMGALEALIGSDANVPQALRDIARERLKSIQPKN